ncbi:putative Bile acid:sodium symporter [Zostera marina]|uniref:Probable sodium/metabolite cotransporter BASS4, chloroplastic n=1 Tax=Zostera marina TaxID=29655 RepID=A0A0K9PAR1_ZOSMR|nr:putative Bile acid:sodium symporter [Zostera marina]
MAGSALQIYAQSTLQVASLKRRWIRTSSQSIFHDLHRRILIQLPLHPQPPFHFLRSRLALRPIRSKTSSSGEVEGDGEGGSSIFEDRLDWARPLLKFLEANFLPLALISSVILGVANPTLGCLAHSYSLSKYSTFGIFVISGLMLKSEEIGAAAKSWQAGTYGLISILLFTPFFSRLILQLQLSPREFLNGLAIFCCVPTTLSSGVALTQLARGNTALALAMTVLSNLLGILFVPFSLSSFIGHGSGVTIPTKQLFQNLTFTLLIPLIIGKVLRDSFRNIAQYVDGNKRRFSMVSAILLSLVPWMQMSRSRSLLLTTKLSSFLIAMILGMFLHLVLLAFNTFAVQSLSVMHGDSGKNSVFAKKENARAVIIVTSQKTLPVTVVVVEQLGGALGESGLLVLPCIAAHIIQIIIDSFLVNYWLQKDQSSTGNTIDS